ncbi:MAG: phenylalanine--tRNA ligase subunit beta [Deltaproteobacteria bacterium]|nr:phenylalanine--tRNA ligase subunit beta [Deltaproteobacteria bacterium]
MKISYQWLKEFVDLKMKAGALAERLVLGGIEVEAIESTPEDAILEVAVPPNRADLMSHFGLAREIAALTASRLFPLKAPKIASPKNRNKEIQVKIQDPKLCPRYSGALIHGVRPTQSPAWMVDRLERCGIRSIHPIVDITNYVLLEIGQPLHAFDAQKLQGSWIEVRAAREKERFFTIDHQELSLNKTSLVIANAEKAVALAGVIGGLETEIDSETSDLFLESAIFSPISIRRTSRAYGIRTESSQRFERGVDPEGVYLGLTRAIELLLEISGGELRQLSNVVSDPLRSPRLNLRQDHLSGILGRSFRGAEVAQCLKALGCKIELKKTGWSVVPPSYRRDLEQEIDLVEEVARWKGYDTFSEAIPPIPFQRTPGDPLYATGIQLREWMKQAGFLEIITYPYVSKTDLQGLKMEKAISLQNPLSEEQSELRPSLVPSLLQTAKYHTDRKMSDLRLFEIGKTFASDGDKVCESLKLGAVWSGLRLPEQWGTDKSLVDLFDLKGCLEKLFQELYRRSPDFRGGVSLPFLHPENFIRIFEGEQEWGYLAELHPEIQREKEFPQPLYLFEINLERLGPIPKMREKYQALSKYPGISRDFSFIVPNRVKYEEIIRACSQFKGGILKDLWLFDLYKGSKIPGDSKSLALRFFFQREDRTLTEEEVESQYQAMKSHLTREVNHDEDRHH